MRHGQKCQTPLPKPLRAFPQSYRGGVCDQIRLRRLKSANQGRNLIILATSFQTCSRALLAEPSWRLRRRSNVTPHRLPSSLIVSRRPPSSTPNAPLGNVVRYQIPVGTRTGVSLEHVRRRSTDGRGSFSVGLLPRRDPALFFPPQLLPRRAPARKKTISTGHVGSWHSRALECCHGVWNAVMGRGMLRRALECCPHVAASVDWNASTVTGAFFVVGSL